MLEISEVNRVYDEFLTKYSHRDILGPDTNLIFIFDYPFMDYPHRIGKDFRPEGQIVAGSIFNDDKIESFDKFVTDEISNGTTLRNLGILYASPVPLFLNHYNQETLTKEEYDLLSELNLLGAVFGLDRAKRPVLREVRDRLLQTLFNRLEPLKDENMEFILCGSFCRNYFEFLLDLYPNFKVVYHLPSPKYTHFGFLEQRDLYRIRSIMLEKAYK